MGKKYIIELLDDCPSEFKGIIVFGLTPEGQISAEPIPVEDLPTYTEPDLDAIRNEAYEKGVQDTKQHWVDAPRSCAYKLGYENGINDAWEAARKICAGKFCGKLDTGMILNLTASEAIEKIRQYEQEQEESEESKKEQSVTAEEVMRQYLDRFCKGKSCTRCPLYTSDFTCGRGYHFLTNRRVSDEEVRRAYAEVLEKMREGQDE